MHNGPSLIDYARTAAAVRAEDAANARRTARNGSALRRVAGTALMQLGYRLNPTPPWPSAPSERGAC